MQLADIEQPRRSGDERVDQTGTVLFALAKDEFVAALARQQIAAVQLVEPRKGGRPSFGVGRPEQELATQFVELRNVA